MFKNDWKMIKISETRIKVGWPKEQTSKWQQYSIFLKIDRNAVKNSNLAEENLKQFVIVVYK